MKFNQKIKPFETIVNINISEQEEIRSSMAISETTNVRLSNTTINELMLSNQTSPCKMMAEKPLSLLKHHLLCSTNNTIMQFSTKRTV